MDIDSGIVFRIGLIFGFILSFLSAIFTATTLGSSNPNVAGFGASVVGLVFCFIGIVLTR